MISERLSILFIHGINEDVSERDLYEELNDFPILYIKLPKDQKTSKALGYGFLGFKNPLDGKFIFIFKILIIFQLKKFLKNLITENFTKKL